MKKVVSLLIALMMVATLLAGCATKQETAAAAVEEAVEASVAADVAEEAAVEAVAEAAAEDAVCKIYYIPNNMGNPYFEAIEKGFNDAFEELGPEKFDFTYTGPAEANATSQIEYVEAAVQNGADIVFCAANSQDAMNATFDEAREAGTAIYIINQDIPGSEDHRDCAVMPCDFSTVGVAQVELCGSLIGYEGEIAVLSATTDAPDQNTWIDGMKEVLASDPKYAKMELVDVVYGDDQPDKSTTEMEALLAKYPNLRGVIAPTTVGVCAAAKVVQTQGVKDQVKLTGLGLPSEMQAFVKDGSCEAFQLWNPPYEGYLAGYVAYRTVFEGWEPTPGAKIDCGKLGEYTVEDNGQIITLKEPMTYDASNIDEYAALF